MMRNVSWANELEKQPWAEARCLCTFPGVSSGGFCSCCVGGNLSK